MINKSISVMSPESESFLAFENKIFNVLDILRGEIEVNEYLQVLCYSLFLKKEGVLNKLNEISIASIEDAISQIENEALESKLYQTSSDIEQNLKVLFWSSLNFQPYLKKISKRSLVALVNAINDLDDAAVTLFFEKIIEGSIYRSAKILGKRGEPSVQPRELSDFIVSLSELKKSDKVYNPFAGLASFGRLIDKDILYVGQERNKDTHLLGFFRLLLGGRKIAQLKSDYLCGDSVRDWNPKKEKYDLIVACPPFNMRIDEEISGIQSKIKTVEQFLIMKGISDLTPRGKLIIVIPQGFLYRGGPEETLRKELVDDDLLEMVISFPGGIFSNTSIPVSVIIINKKKKEPGVVRFIDANHFVDNISKEKRINHEALYSIVNNEEDSDSLRIVKVETIVGNNYYLNNNRYFISSLSASEIVAADSQIVKLGDFLAVLKTNIASGTLEQNNLLLCKPYNSQMAKSGLTTAGKYVRIRDLADDRLNYLLDVNNVSLSELPKQSFEVKASALLLALRWNTLKPTYFEYKGESIFVNNDIIALEVDDKKVDIAYLINELQADYVLNSVRSLRTGTTIPTIRKQDLFMVEIVLPPIEKQQSKMKRVKETLFFEKNKELDILRKIHGLENELVEQNTYLRHSLAGRANNLSGSIKSLTKILNEQILPLLPNAMDLKETPLSTLSLGKYISIIERDIKKISEGLTKAIRVENAIEEKKLQPVDIIEFLENYTGELKARKDLRYRMDFSIDIDAFKDEDGTRIKTLILANTDLLTDLFNNLIKNAEVHAFTEFPARVTAQRTRPNSNSHNRIEIYVMLNSDKGVGNEEESDIVILVSNTGKGFPENFNFSDFIRKGSKAGKHSGDGFGGWYINEIIKKFNGQLDIIDEQGVEGLPDTDLSTSFEITIPVIQFDNDENL